MLLARNRFVIWRFQRDRDSRAGIGEVRDRRGLVRPASGGLGRANLLANVVGRDVVAREIVGRDMTGRHASVSFLACCCRLARHADRALTLPREDQRSGRLNASRGLSEPRAVRLESVANWASCRDYPVPTEGHRDRDERRCFAGHATIECDETVRQL